MNSITSYQTAFKSNNPEELMEGYKSLKSEIYDFTKLILDNKEDFSIIEDIWEFIKKGLLSENGNVRNHAFYTFKRFRGSIVIFESSVNLKILEELYEISLKQQNKKVKQVLLRSILEMSCMALEFIAKDNNFFKKYREIIECASAETKGKYEKKKNRKDILFERLGRSITDLARLKKNLYESSRVN